MATREFIYPFVVCMMMLCITGCSGTKENGATELEVPEKHEEQDTFFLSVDEMPEIIGGLQSIQRRLRYPELAKQAGIEGTVYIFAFVDSEGNVARTEILNDPGGGLGETAAEVIQQTRFKPGRQDGKPVPVRVSIPIHFRLAMPVKDVHIHITEGPEDLSEMIRRPTEARDKEVKGEVYVVVTLNEYARVTAIELIDGIGYGWDEAVMQAVAQYPFYKDDEYIAVTEPQSVSIRIQFSLE